MDNNFTWPELNTEIRELEDTINKRFKAIYFMYLTVQKENVELNSKVKTLTMEIENVRAGQAGSAKRDRVGRR